MKETYKRTFTPTRAVIFIYSLSGNTKVVDIYHREMSFVKVVYKYTDVVLIHEPPLLIYFFKRQASFETKPF